MNKHILIAAVLSTFLSGCQTISRDVPITKLPSNTASPQEISDALTIDTLGGDEVVEQLEEAPVFDDVWERIRYQLSIEVPQNRPVVAERNYYARHQAYMDRIAKRAEPYLYYIVEEVEKRKMPMEIALLPIVESAFDPYGYSHRSASGIWQFMPQTGKRFGLKQNWWYDGRRDIAESTRAALDYLSYLHKTLEGDWLNAIAAYNSGEGRVMRAIKKNRRKHLPTDFWSLDLPRETTAYVPKLLALADLLKRHDEFGIKWNKIVNAQVIDRVDVGSQIDLALAAEMAGISLSELYRLNPAFNRWATDPQGPHHLLLPLDSITPFKQQLASAKLQDRLRWQQYEVAAGDSLSVIAKKFNTSVGAIRTLNALESSTIRAGQTLMVPLSDKAASHLPEKVRLAVNGTTSLTRSHTVKSGDTLWDLSREYNVTVAQLKAWNNLGNNAMLRLGQKLKIRQSTGQALPQTTNRTITYKVRRGDSLSRIAKQFGLRVGDIRKWNNLNGKKYLYPGQKLKLIVAVKRG
ncbi:Membrane-bound lytic murein transglycosylase D precursor [Pseudoalteromonas sp. THAF3]|uniref:LysM peptidoglycan-binding domain-containing protein n=1 Tax=Pseudoalteromonas sp. THAF3 TaxID=2587843 RepID=UPI0012681AA4|nr:LysM peptidoglycan-binding domain-containing protein [Pseudoalteromonas sp. THAF3]QFU05277.1 Membrane-bound lytic murein transglycosylase D precursor [Pseudoalteromonas sp. THAF3]